MDSKELLTRPLNMAKIQKDCFPPVNHSLPVNPRLRGPVECPLGIIMHERQESNCQDFGRINEHLFNLCYLPSALDQLQSPKLRTLLKKRPALHLGTLQGRINLSHQIRKAGSHIIVRFPREAIIERKR